jgi:hypothetical protein
MPTTSPVGKSTMSMTVLPPGGVVRAGQLPFLRITLDEVGLMRAMKWK